MVATPVWWFYVFWLPDYLSQGRGFSLQDIGLYGWIPYLTVDLGKMGGGAVSDALLARGYSATVARKSVMLGGAVFTFVVGQVVDRTGYAPVFWTVGSLALVACLALFFWVGPVARLREA